MRNERPVIAQESRHEQKSLTIRRAGRDRSIHTATAHAGALWGARDRVPDRQRFWVVTYRENDVEELPRPPHRATKWFKSSLHDLSRDWYRWLGVRGCGVRSGMSSKHGGQNQQMRPLKLNSCFRFRIPAQMDKARPSGHPVISRLYQQSSAYLQSSSPTRSSRHGPPCSFHRVESI